MTESTLLPGSKSVLFLYFAPSANMQQDYSIGYSAPLMTGHSSSFQ